VLQVWAWGKWNWDDADDDDGPEHFTGHPNSIDALLPVDDDAIVTGSSDGIIRLLTVHPNKLVGVIGEHGDDGVERLRGRVTEGCSPLHPMTTECDSLGNVSGYLFEDDDDDAVDGSSAAAATGAPRRGSLLSTSRALAMGG